MFFLFSVVSEETESGKNAIIYIRFRVFKFLWLVQLPTGTLFRHGVVLVICLCFVLETRAVYFLKYFDKENFILVYFILGLGLYHLTI